MKNLLFIVILLIFASGCASTGRIEAQIEDLKREIKDTEQRLQMSISRKSESLGKNIDELKESHEKDIKDINLTLIDIQKDFLRNKAVVEDTARRVYLLEMLITAKRQLPPEQKEGFIEFVKENVVAISLGSSHGVKVGDIFAVYKDESSREKIASIKILTADLESSLGEIIEKIDDIAIGYRVEIVKD